MIRIRRSVFVAAAAAAALAGAAAFLGLRSGAGAEASEPDAVSEAIATSAAQGFATDVAIPVAGAPVVRETLTIGVSAAGQAEAWRRAVVTAQVAGRVASVPVRENDAVGAGRPLVAIDAAEYQLAVDDAAAKLRDAEAKFREMTLFDERIADASVRAERERIARSRSGLEGAEVALRRARFDLARTAGNAPFPGRVASVRVVQGQWVRVGDELMTVVDLDPIRVEVQVLESEVGYLVAGRGARISFAAFPGEAFAGRVETINPVVESGTRTARVTVVVANPGGRILPGMYARVTLDARQFADRVLVPRAAILERDRRPMLFVYEGDERGGRARWRYVTTGLANDTHVEIVDHPDTETVRPGETVLVDGHYTLIHDARVRVVDDVREAGGRPN
jgi:membrane fusion protein, multidrug efflux system